MLAILWLTIPVYLVIALGYGAIRLGYLSRDAVPPLGAFVVRIALPCLIFTAIAAPDVEREIDPAIGLAYLAASLVALAAGLAVARVVFRRTASQAWILGLGTSLSNSGFMGFPIVSELMGADLATQFFAIALIVENAVVLPLALVAADMCSPHEGSRAQGLRRVLGAMARNPILVGVLVAIAVRLGGLPVPDAVLAAAGMLAGVAPPLALFVVGATIAQYPLRADVIEPGVITGLKLVVQPAATLAVLLVVPLPAADLVPVAVLFAAMPMLSIFPIVAAPYEVERVGASALVLSTALSFVTVAIWAALLDV